MSQFIKNNQYIDENETLIIDSIPEGSPVIKINELNSYKSVSNLRLCNLKTDSLEITLNRGSTEMDEIEVDNCDIHNLKINRIIFESLQVKSSDIHNFRMEYPNTSYIKPIEVFLEDCNNHLYLGFGKNTEVKEMMLKGSPEILDILFDWGDFTSPIEYQEKNYQKIHNSRFLFNSSPRINRFIGMYENCHFDFIFSESVNDCKFENCEFKGFKNTTISNCQFYDCSINTISDSHILDSWFKSSELESMGSVEFYNSQLIEHTLNRTDYYDDLRFYNTPIRPRYNRIRKEKYGLGDIQNIGIDNEMKTQRKSKWGAI